MSKVSRSDWAAQVPAEGIIGIIPAKNIPTTPTGKVDMGSITGTGFSPGQIPVWNGSKFAPGNVPVPPTTGLTLTVLNPFILWGTSLRPLESTEQVLTLLGVTANSRVFLSSPVGQDYLFFQAKVTGAPLVTILATNMSGAPVTLIDGVYSIFVLT